MDNNEKFAPRSNQFDWPQRIDLYGEGADIQRYELTGFQSVVAVLFDTMKRGGCLLNRRRGEWLVLMRALIGCWLMVGLAFCQVNAETRPELATGNVADIAFVPRADLRYFNYDKPFNEYSWATAHNAYEDDMKAQLNRGVRGFMLDLYPSQKEMSIVSPIRMCHGGPHETCRDNKKSFVDEMNNVFVPFVKNNPNEVITLFIESHVTRRLFEEELRKISDIENLAFDPRLFSEKKEWPTLREIIKSGRRIIITADLGQIIGRYNINGSEFNVFRDSELQIQNTYDLGANALNHQWACVTRWSPGPDDPAIPGEPCKVEGIPKGCPENGVPCTTEPEPKGCPIADVPARPNPGIPFKPSTITNWLPGMQRLPVLNQFHAFMKSQADAGNIDNNLTYLERRVDRYCAQTAGERVVPNYIAIDYSQVGDTVPYARALSNGGVYFYEQNNANSAGDTTCVLPVDQDWDLTLPSNGCENDEARSLKLRGVPKGTRITVHDSKTGNEDDFSIIDVTRDAPLDPGVVVSSFQKTESTPDYNIRHFRNNGLDGKVSRIKIERHPVEFSEAQIVLKEGNDGGQNITCAVPLVVPTSFDMGGACDNDETRSAIITSAKAGVKVTLYGNWGANKCDQGCLSVEVKKDITFSKTIPSYEKSYEDDYVKVTRSGGSQQLDGKVSSIRVEFVDGEPPSEPILSPKAAQLGTNSATLTWAAANDNVGVTGYQVSVEGGASFFVDGTSHTLTGLQADTAYTVRVRAKDAAGNLSPPASISFHTMLNPPAGVQLNHSNGLLTASWLPKAQTIYEVWINDTNLMHEQGTGLVQARIGQNVPPSSVYTVKIRAKKGSNSSEFIEVSKAVSASHPGEPGDPVFSELTENSVKINWTPSASDEPLKGYSISISGLPLGIVQSNNFNISSLASGTPYIFTVSAKNISGNWSPVKVGYFKTLGNPVQPPPEPPKNLRASTVAPNSVKLSWDFGERAFLYLISDEAAGITKPVVTVKEVLLEGLTEGRTYHFKVRAYDLYQQPSEQAAEISVTVPDLTPPSSPEFKSFTQLGETSARIEWYEAPSDEGVTGYMLKLGDAALKPVTTTSYEASGLNLGASYTVEVSAKDAVGNLSPASQIGFTMEDMTAPTPPRDTIVRAVDSSSATVSWSAASDNTSVAGYDIYLDDQRIITLSSTVTSYSLTGLSEGETYRLKVRAFDGQRNQADGEEVVFKALNNPPTRPENLHATKISGVSALLLWQPSTDDGGVSHYEISKDGVVLDTSQSYAYIAKALVPETPYKFAVRAIDFAGNQSLWSAPLTVSTRRFGAATKPNISNATRYSVTFGWQRPEDGGVMLIGYKVRFTKPGGGIIDVNTPAMELSVPGLLPNTTYKVSVTAFDYSDKYEAEPLEFEVSTVE